MWKIIGESLSIFKKLLSAENMDKQKLILCIPLSHARTVGIE